MISLEISIFKSLTLLSILILFPTVVNLMRKLSSAEYRLFLSWLWSLLTLTSCKLALIQSISSRCPSTFTHRIFHSHRRPSSGPTTSAPSKVSPWCCDRFSPFEMISRPGGFVCCRRGRVPSVLSFSLGDCSLRVQGPQEGDWQDRGPDAVQEERNHSSYSSPSWRSRQVIIFIQTWPFI